MNRNTVNRRQFAYMLTLFILGSALMTGGYRYTPRDTWIAILLSAVFTLPVFIIYARISSLFPEDSIYQIIYTVFGRFFGCVFSVILIVFFLHISVIAAGTFNMYTRSASLNTTPYIFIALPLSLLAAWLAIKGIQVMGRVGTLMFFIVLPVIIIVALLALGNYNFENMLPVLEYSPREILRSSRLMLVLPFAESVIFLTASGRIKKTQGKYLPFILGLIISGVIFAAVSLRSLLMLGEYSYVAARFPAVTAASIIQIGNYLQRIETAVSLGVLCCVFMRLAVCFYGAAEGMEHIFRLKKSAPVILIFAVFSAAASLFIYPAIESIYAFGEKYFIYLISIEILFPVLLWLGAELRAAKIKRQRKLHGV